MQESYSEADKDNKSMIEEPSLEERLRSTSLGIGASSLHPDLRELRDHLSGSKNQDAIKKPQTEWESSLENIGTFYASEGNYFPDYNDPSQTVLLIFIPPAY